VGAVTGSLRPALSARGAVTVDHRAAPPAVLPGQGGPRAATPAWSAWPSTPSSPSTPSPPPPRHSTPDHRH